MKNDYILEQPLGRRRSRRWLHTLLAGMLFAISMAALILSYQDADAQHPASAAGDTDTVVLHHPLALEPSALSDPSEAEVDTAPMPTQLTTVPSVALNTNSSPKQTTNAPKQEVKTSTRTISRDNSANLRSVKQRHDRIATTSIAADNSLTPLLHRAVTRDTAPKTPLDSVEAAENDADFDNPQSEAGGDVDTRPPLMALDDDANWSDVTVKAGDSLSAIFSRNGLPANDWLTLAKNKAAKPLLNMRPGKDLQIRKTDGGRLAELVYPIDSTHTLRVTRRNENFDVQVEKAAIEHRRAYAQGQVKTSLYLAGAAAGLSPRQTMQLTKIFSWNIDFAREVRRGDRFTVIYNQIWHDGHKLRNGDIVAAEFTVHGHTFRAFRYADRSGDSNNYYTADGSSLRRALERAPVNYHRISSPFNRHRMHPILHIVRPHLGVDYAAPTGTPVHAAGDGRIEFAGRKGGYGNVVVIRHNPDYETVYAHLHDFARGIHTGVYVKQNRVIGHVGQTGLATGPHLHFGIRVDGRFENPRTVALPHADPVPKRYFAKFKHITHPLLARLKELDRTGPRLASNH